MNYVQEQIYSDEQSLEQLTEELLAENEDNILALSSPYTVYVKQMNSSYYLFFAYSMGRPRNIIWGEIKTGASKKIDVTFGCNWNKMSIIRDATERIENKGFYVVSSYAKDKANPKILSYLIAEAYTDNTGVQFKTAKINRKDIRKLMDGYLSDENITFAEAALNVAYEILVQKNLAQILSKGKIPIYVIEGIHHFLEHNPTLSSGSLPMECKTFDECLESPDRTCDLYNYDFEAL